MNSERTIQEQSYLYFLTEAQDLLQVLETDLLTLKEDSSNAKIYNLMRATHTLKGASANVGQETIKTISHYLEDVFKALLSPEAKIDPELEDLLFQGYECLRIALTSELTGERSQDSDVLNRAATVFAQLQEKLGDCFNHQAPLPSSSELGFDITQSIFETGVKQRLDQLAEALQAGAESDRQTIGELLRSHAEIFLGLAESLNLQGFKAIAELTLAALEKSPDQIITIAQIALADFQQGDAAVLKGDRTRGGEPSPALQQLAGANSKLPSPEDNLSLEETFGNVEIEPALQQLAGANSQLSSSEDDLSLEETFGNVEIEPEQLTFGNNYVVDEWADTETTKAELVADDFAVSAVNTSSPIPEPPPQTLTPPVVANSPAPPPTSQTVRVEIEQLDLSNHLIGELLINQNQLALQDEQFQTAIQKLLDWLKQHRQTISQLHDGLLGSGEWGIEKSTHSATSNHELHRLLHSAVEELGQLEQATEDVDLLDRFWGRTVERQQRLLTQLRDNMQSARMMPIGNILSRFPRMVQQLSAVHHKPVELRVSGTQVFVDKAIAESLYDALLHLVRNAFDHGIEPAEVRQQQGKPEVGSIEIRAFNQGNRTIIEISDDGKGLDFEKIYRRALELNKLTPEQVESIRRLPLPETKLLELLCEPGFSTAAEVSDLSGRGVGLDVVRTQLRSLKASFSLSSQIGRGTTFSLQIRGALMSARLLVCQAGNAAYAFVSNEISQVLMPRIEQIKLVGGQKVLIWQQGQEQSTVPLYKLASLFEYRGVGIATISSSNTTQSPELSPLLTPRDTNPVLLLQTVTGFVGLEIDKIMEEQELIIKPLPEAIVPPVYVYGCSILADGRLTLVIDGAMLINYVETKTIAFNRQLAVQIASKSPQLSAVAASANSQEPYLITGENAPEFSSPSAPKLKTILVIDDSLTERQTLTLILHKAGCQVVTAQDGLEALEKLKQNQDIDLAICDLEMPKMNGLEFLTARRQHPNIAKIPTVMLTSCSREKYQQIALELGAIAYLTKPYLESEITNQISAILS